MDNFHHPEKKLYTLGKVPSRKYEYLAEASPKYKRIKLMDLMTRGNLELMSKVLISVARNNVIKFYKSTQSRNGMV